MEVNAGKQPVLPRRAFVAAGLSAVFAGGAIGLAALGGLSGVETEVFGFSRGTSFVNGDEERLRGMLAQALQDDRIHVTILGHTGQAGEADANLELSQTRADLARSIATDLGISGDRITARGVGGGSPLAKTDGESERAYQSRLARVEVSLQMRR